MVNLAIGAGLLICLGLTYFGFRLVRLKRHIENVPTSKSSGLVFGLSEIQGRIHKLEDHKPLESPLTFSSCYWYYYKVEEKQGSGDNEKWGKKLMNAKITNHFIVKTAQGKPR